VDVNAKVDIGGNLTSLLERLAQQIGTTVDKVYPWYVQQAHNEGITALIAFVLLLLIAMTFFLIGFAAVGSENREKRDLGGGMAFVSGLVLILLLTFGVFEAVTAVRKIMNPNFYAMGMLTNDIGKLTGK
jgi:fumarate reductase subunit D